MICFFQLYFIPFPPPSPPPPPNSKKEISVNWIKTASSECEYNFLCILLKAAGEIYLDEFQNFHIAETKNKGKKVQMETLIFSKNVLFLQNVLHITLWYNNELKRNHKTVYNFLRILPPTYGWLFYSKN